METPKVIMTPQEAHEAGRTAYYENKDYFLDCPFDTREQFALADAWYEGWMAAMKEAEAARVTIIEAA